MKDKDRVDEFADSRRYQRKTSCGCHYVEEATDGLEKCSR